MAQNKDTTAKTNTKAVKVRYETTDVQFVSQFMINAGAEELVLNLSPGYLADPGSNENILPIHARFAMTYSGAARLVQTLSQVLRNVNDPRQQTLHDGDADVHEATLPKFTQ